MPVTTNYGWTEPTVGGDSGNWGSILNTLIGAVDSVVHGIDLMAQAALPKAGGVMTGRLDAKTTSMARLALGGITGAASLDLSAAQAFTAAVTANVTITITNPAAGVVAQGFILQIDNGGAHTITWPAAVKWAGGSAPAFSAAGRDLLAFVTFDNGATWDAVLVAKGVA